MKTLHYKKGMRKKNIFICLLFIISFSGTLPAQEALKSIEEEYYDFFALQGLTERPTLNYRTLSDSVWKIDGTEEHPWQGNNLGVFHPLFGDFRVRVYGPELFMSANTAAPYGQNDGVLWQGRGFNSLFKSGVRFEGYGIELTLLPHFAFSQNADFDIMPPSYDSEYGYFWGYAHNVGVDAPQRFGDKPFFDWDFGDSEIRYTWKTLTIGFGTQTIWLGPAYLNPILHSNNAPAYPKFDIGLRRQRVTIPRLDWYIGDVEARLWVGRLEESNYFDNDDANNYTMIHGLSFAYAPSFLPGLTLFANRICLAPWAWENLSYIIPEKMQETEDQKLSLGFSWILPQVGFEVYGELGIDDYTKDIGTGAYLRHPFHTTVYTAGLKRSLQIIPEKKIYGELIFEFNWMEMTQDFQFEWPYSFYFHHQLTHGYTNRGQWLGAGSGWAGNNQFLAFILYYPQGTSSLFIQRNNPDNNYLFKNAIYDTASDPSLRAKNQHHYKANFNIGVNSCYFITKYINVSGGIVYNMIINPFYKRTKETDNMSDKPNEPDGDNVFLHNFSFQLGVKIKI
jgi:hypothetical protein